MRQFGPPSSMTHRIFSGWKSLVFAAAPRWFHCCWRELLRKVYETKWLKKPGIYTRHFDMDESKGLEGVGVGKLFSWPLELETLEVWCGANADICELDLEPKDQDGVGGTTRGDQDVDLQNGSELVVVQETWHIRMWFYNLDAQLIAAPTQTCMAHREPIVPRKSKHQFKLDETISSSGLVMLFYGDSGVVYQLSDQGESGHSIWPAHRNLKIEVWGGFYLNISPALECGIAQANAARTPYYMRVLCCRVSFFFGQALARPWPPMLLPLSLSGGCARCFVKFQPSAKANLLGKKLLLINFPSLGGEQVCRLHSCACRGGQGRSTFT